MEQEFESIAIVGMAGSFPKAANIEEFWNNLKSGVNCITYYSEKELIDAGIDPELIQHPDYVKGKGTLADIDMFDADLFDIGPREAELMDPQHRLLLECSLTALEHAGYNPDKYPGLIGIYAGESMSSYAYLNVLPSMTALLSTRNLQAAIGNDKDSLTTTVAYHLNLRGPAITVQTSSSTSLVAISLACQQLLSYHCDMALAGGVSAGPPIISGYLHEEGGINSSDGKCRAFDHKSDGFVPGSGVGLVVLKRLSEAINDRDTIWAVIKGFAINNDGKKKVNYSAPSVDAQAEVIMMAQEYAQIDPESIGYIEAHGTGTKLGDPVELAALTKAFKQKSQNHNYCALGSVKTNIGHLDAAAGVAGLIKTTLCLKYKTLVPSLHFEHPNPQLHLDNSPFFISTALCDWKPIHKRLQAGVTSLGMGGTNTHVVLEEAPELTRSYIKKSTPILLTLSAKSPSALQQYLSNTINFLESNLEIDLQDIVYTLNVGRKPMKYRMSFMVESRTHLINILKNALLTHAIPTQAVSSSSLSFSYSSGALQSIGLTKQLFERHPIFQSLIHECLDKLPAYIRERLSLLFQNSICSEEVLANLNKEEKSNLHFIIDYSLSALLIKLGISPDALFGIGLGEVVAGVVSGVLSLETAINLFNSRAMKTTSPLSIPKIPFISALTGDWITEEQAMSLSYWQDVVLNQSASCRGMEAARTNQPKTICFIQPSTLYHIAQGSPSDLFSTNQNMISPNVDIDANQILLKSVGQLFENGIDINWSTFYQDEQHCRIPCPTYPFERKRYWIEAPRLSSLSKEKQTSHTFIKPRPSIKTTYIAPSSQKEKEVTALWEDALGISPIGINDNFFDLGGSSLEATILITSAHDSFHHRMSLKDFYNQPTIHEMAQRLGNDQAFDFLALLDEVTSNKHQ